MIIVADAIECETGSNKIWAVAARSLTDAISLKQHCQNKLTMLNLRSLRRELKLSDYKYSSSSKSQEIAIKQL